MVSPSDDASSFVEVEEVAICGFVRKGSSLHVSPNDTLPNTDLQRTQGHGAPMAVDGLACFSGTGCPSHLSSRQIERLPLALRESVAVMLA